MHRQASPGLVGLSEEVRLRKDLKNKEELTRQTKSHEVGDILPRT